MPKLPGCHVRCPTNSAGQSAHLGDEWRRAIGWLGLAGVLAGATLLTNSTPYPGRATLLPVIGTVCILIAGQARRPGTFGVGGMLGTPMLHGLGRLSYSWYLWHWPVLALGMTLMPATSPLARSVLVGVSLVLATASHVLVENPIRFSRYLIHRPK